MLDGHGQGSIPPLNQISLEDSEIEDFERLVHQRQYELATRRLLVLLERLYRIYRMAGRIVAPEFERHSYTRLAAAVCTLLTDPEYALSESGFGSLALHHSTLGYLFSASAFGGAEHMAALVGTRDPGRPDKLDYASRERMLKLLLSHSLDSGLDLDLEGLLRSDSQRLLPLYLGMLNRYIFLTPSAHRLREMLLGIGASFENCSLSMQCLPSLAVAWMNCMYATSDSKHAVKRPLNRLAASLVQPPVSWTVRRPRPLSKRPVMLVLVEDMRSGHVNHRTYGPVLAELRERFTLVAAASPNSIDDGTRALFDRVVEIAVPSDEAGYSALVQQIAALQADIAYYPTLGMQPWCIVAATQRLAPIQVATMGVPATTHSDVMDYLVVEESWAGNPDCYSETVVLTRRGSTRFLPRAGSVVERPKPRKAGTERNGPVRIAVPAMAPKLSLPFLETCSQIASASRVPLEWYFFAGFIGLQHTIVANRIRGLIPGARVFPNLDYDTYLRVLGECDLHLSTYPFGGTNTNLDTMHLGIPIVTLAGRECHSQIDAGMMRRVKLPEWLIARNEMEYTEAALRLIHDRAARQKIRNALLKADLDTAFLSKGTEAERDSLSAFCWIYKNHETLQRSGRRYWTVAERESQMRK